MNTGIWKSPHGNYFAIWLGLAVVRIGKQFCPKHNRGHFRITWNK